MLRRCLLIGVAFATLVIAHGGHTPVNIQEEAKKPVSAKTWIHIALEATAWIVLFPLAMVLGLVRHKLHVPLASAAVAMSLAGYILGGHHGGRQFPHTVHGTMAKILLLVLLIQTFCGVYLKLHLQWKPEKVVRPIVLRVHGIFGRMFPILGWTQMVFGIATLQSWCRGGHLGQCLAHYIMGSAFAGYSVILLIMLKCAVEWLRRKNVSEEYLDSWVILLWGIVNTFTEHHGGPWTHKDLQHTLMGVLWWTGGAVGVWLSRKGKRSIFPAIIISLTGWAMSGHAQALDKPTGEETLGENDNGWFKIHAFQYFVLIDMYVGYGGRYGLAQKSPGVEAPAPSNQASWSYARLPTPQSDEPERSQAVSESIGMEPYTKTTRPSMSDAEHHVLFDEDDPFNDKDLHH
ncbi:hypothetical protein MPSI1_001799 [Malassezia psittaci]|uniref:Cytochrome b561 domain-containing protein n=1 Tax=Malassezia psittaci TaxID=1821823 RepID=A0AAF0F505_9BASI|nr:hypothetical protein MPSI1_001799 [Malassezia psittaci]